MAELVKSNSGLGQQAMTAIARGRGQFASLPQSRQTGLLVSLLLLVACIAGAGWYVSRPDWRLLFSGLEGREVQMVEQELGAAGMTYQSTPEGTGVEVPAELLDKARMEIASKGMPQTGRLGFELFDKPNWVGSEFDEKVNYQRALEGELEHTIESLSAIRSARVHLVLPAESLFSAEAKVAKASVVLKLRRMDLGREQVDSIRRLVAGAIENLDPANVTLVDADGRQNLMAKGEHAREGEADQAMEAKLVEMLEPMVGAGNVRAVVNTSFDDSAEERTDEIFDPTQTVTLSSEKTDQVSAGPAIKASGVPGTASNTPAAAPVGAVQGSKTAAAPGVPPLLKEPAPAKEALPVYPDKTGGGGSSMKQESATFGVTKHVIHHQEDPGRLRRVTVAVLVNDRLLLDPAGHADKSSWKPRSSEEMHRLEGLTQAAVGFDVKRGDTVTVENVSFSSNESEPAPAGMAKVMDQAKVLLQAQPNALHAGMLGLLGILLVMLVLRPVAQQMVSTLKAPAGLTAAQRLSVAGGAGMEALGQGSGARLADEEHAVSSSMVVEQLADHIRRKPLQSTRLLENWIEGSKGGA